MSNIDNQVKCFYEQICMLWLMAEFREAEFYSVNVRADLVLLVAYHSLFKEGV